MIYLVAIFIAAAGALIGWQLGLAVFIAVFEILRWLHLEALLDLPAALTAFRYAHIAAVIAIGALAAATLAASQRPGDLRREGRADRDRGGHG